MSVLEEGPAVPSHPCLHLSKGGPGLAQEPTTGGWQEESETSVPDPQIGPLRQAALLPELEEAGSPPPHLKPCCWGRTSELEAMIRGLCSQPEKARGQEHVADSGHRHGGDGTKATRTFSTETGLPWYNCLGPPLCLGLSQAPWPLQVAAQHCVLHSLERQ